MKKGMEASALNPSPKFTKQTSCNIVCLSVAFATTLLISLFANVPIWLEQVNATCGERAYLTRRVLLEFQQRDS